MPGLFRMIKRLVIYKGPSDVEGVELLENKAAEGKSAESTNDSTSNNRNNRDS